jgi:Outer membrane protein and related peptidoglycan-associated (lipo)proteins
MKWSLVPIGGGAHGGAVNARIEFIPNAAVASASKNISFIQTVSTIDTHRSGVSGFFGFGSTTATNPEVDKGEGDTDPFYGAQWNRGASRWGDEPQSVQARFGDRSGQGLAREGSRPFNASNPSAVLNDTPMLQVNEAKDFETVAVVLETGRVLGSLRWNIQCWSAGFFNDSSSTIVRRAECVADPSSGFESVANSFFTSAGSVVLEGFEPGLADLRPSHPQLLSTVVSNLQRWPSAKAVVGGAATQDEPNPQALSQKRGENVRAYLVAAGVPESRIELEFYGSDWARALVTGGGAGFMNRRVQIRIT